MHIDGVAVGTTMASIR